jgi:hypothetical protein
MPCFHRVWNRKKREAERLRREMDAVAAVMDEVEAYSWTHRGETVPPIGSPYSIPSIVERLYAACPGHRDDVMDLVGSWADDRGERYDAGGDEDP